MSHPFDAIHDEPLKLNQASPATLGRGITLTNEPIYFFCRDCGRNLATPAEPRWGPLVGLIVILLVAVAALRRSVLAGALGGDSCLICWLLYWPAALR